MKKVEEKNKAKYIYWRWISKPLIFLIQDILSFYIAEIFLSIEFPNLIFIQCALMAANEELTSPRKRTRDASQIIFLFPNIVSITQQRIGLKLKNIFKKQF